ncbi:MAG: hypothetical protein R3C32_08145 [Chloroflexota bacterium]
MGAERLDQAVLFEVGGAGARKMSARISASAFALQLAQLAQHLPRGVRVAVQQLHASGGERHAEQRLRHRVVELLGETCALACGGEVGGAPTEVVLQPDLLPEVPDDAVRTSVLASPRHPRPRASRPARGGGRCR